MQIESSTCLFFARILVWHEVGSGTALRRFFAIHISVPGRSSIFGYLVKPPLSSAPIDATAAIPVISSLLEPQEKLLSLLTVDDFWCCLQAIDNCWQEDVAINPAYRTSIQRAQISWRQAGRHHASRLPRMWVVSTCSDSGPSALSVTKITSEYCLRIAAASHNAGKLLGIEANVDK